MRRGAREDGAVAVEFALVLPLLVLFLFGILQFGLFFFRMQGLQAISLDAARGAAVGLSVSELVDRIEDQLTVPVEFDDLDIEVVLAKASGTVATIDGRSASAADQARAVCEGLVDPQDHTVTVTLSVDPALQRYQVVIPIWGTIRLDHSASGTHTCESVA